MGAAIVQEPNPITVGIDVGQIRDNTAITVCEVEQVHTGKYRRIEPVRAHIDERGQWVPPKDADPVMRSEYTVRHIERLPLGTSYPDVAMHIADMLCNPLFANRNVRALFDVTGVGRPVYDDVKREIFLRKNNADVTHQLTEGIKFKISSKHTLHLKPITFRHGETYNRTTGMLGKAFLVSKLQSLLQSTRVHAPKTKEVMAMLDELRVYEIKISEEGKDQYGAFEVGKHDDLATSLALACLEDPFASRVTHSKRVY